MCSHLFVYQAPLGTSAGSYWGFDLSCDRTASWDVVCSHDVSCDVFQSELDPSFKAFNSVDIELKTLCVSCLLFRRPAAAAAAAVQQQARVRHQPGVLERLRVVRVRARRVVTLRFQ